LADETVGIERQFVATIRIVATGETVSAEIAIGMSTALVGDLANRSALKCS
jgi:hypothetical protein